MNTDQLIRNESRLMAMVSILIVLRDLCDALTQPQATAGSVFAQLVLSTSLTIGAACLGLHCALSLLRHIQDVRENTREMAINTQSMKASLEDLSRRFPLMQEDIRQLAKLCDDIHLPGWIKKSRRA